MRPNISQLAHMNPQLQFYLGQQRNSRCVTVARRPAFRPLNAQIIMRLPWRYGDDRWRTSRFLSIIQRTGASGSRRRDGALLPRNFAFRVVTVLL